jgi:tetratricopeptide (TPR) repeat protein
MRNWFTILLLIAVAATGCKQDPERLKRAYAAKGDSFVAEKKYSEAVIEYRNAVATDPRFGEARYKLANTYAALGETRNALPEYVRAADLMPDNVEAQIRAGTGLLRAGQFPEAKTRALSALERDPKNGRALILLGNALGALKDFDGAIGRVQEAIDVDPQEILAYNNLGALEFAAGNREAAGNAFRRAVETNPNSADAHLALANYYWATRNAADTERELDKALELDPKSVMANKGLAVFQLSRGSLDKAEHYLKAYADLTDELSAKLALADFYVQRKNVSQAQETLGALAKTQAGFTVATLRLAALDFVGDRRRQAYEKVEEVLKKDPKSPAALLEKGRFLLADGKIADANAIAAQLVKQDASSAASQFLYGLTLRANGSRDEAVQAFQAALKLNPGSTPAVLHLADLNLALGNIQTAAEFAGQAVRSLPTSTAAHLLLANSQLRLGNLSAVEREVGVLNGSANTNPDVATLIGRFHRERKEFDRARASFETALKLRSHSPEALAGLVEIDLTQGRPDAARKTIEARLAETPKDESTLLLAGKVYQALGDAKRAEASFRQILELNSSNFEVYSRLGGLYRAQNRLEEARQEFEEYAKRQPTHAAAATAMVATILELQNKREEALKQYQRALGYDAKMALAANNLAWAYAQDGRLDEALTLAQTAKSQVPDSGFVSDTLGWIYYQKGNLSSATATLEEATKQTPSNPTIHYHLGLAYAKKGEPAKARGAFEQALKLDPKFTEADDAKRQIAALKG